ncbi:site-specific integrase [Capnocytophaga sp.]|uniref:tyrosine-type recombinase/integrase n=1 Tax=Capnocytophaga sp. TaxID=44737 RepID=UPI0026DD3563|nr:site-specific integrase [Capnocytophaga sp.]MDO5106019.1 site-specific integrase [Capnocytophaga sp.]
MINITQLLASEYESEYNRCSSQPNDMKPYKKPQIFPKVVAEKPLSAFSEKEKQEIMAKNKRWYVYYYFKNKDGKMVKQPSIYYKINQEYKEFDERYKAFHRLRNIVEKLLKNGFSPYEGEEAENRYTCFSALDYALEIKKSIVKPTTFTDYKGRIEAFKKYLKARGLHNSNIADLTKKDINEYLNSVLIKSSPRNRNNTLAVLSAIFSTLEENELVTHNITDKIKKLQAKPERNKTYSKTQESEVFTLMEQKDKDLLLFVKFVSYNFLRPIEVCRLQVKDIDFADAKLNVRAKNKLVKTKIIPEILMKEIQHFKGLNAEYYLFAPKGAGGWEATESNKRDYWSRRFKEIKDELGLGKDYGLYSFRHTFITKLYRELRAQYGQMETYDKLMLITGHTTLSALQQYLRDIDAELPEDYSHLLK